MNYYLSVLKKYAVFTGRASRAEYWYFTLFNSIIAIVLWVFGSLIGDKMSIIVITYSLLVYLPGIAVSIRRLHDIGKSGWMLFISAIPLIGSIWLIILMATNGDSGDNKYGPDPKQITETQ